MIKTWFQKLGNNKQILLITAMLILAVGLIYLPFCFIFPQIDILFSLLWGWLLGGAVSLAAFALLVYQINSLTAEDTIVRLRAAGLLFVRLALYGAGLLIAAILEYQLNVKVLNVFAVLAGYMPVRLVVIAYRSKARVGQ